MTDIETARPNGSEQTMAPWNPLADLETWMHRLGPRRFGFPNFLGGFDGVDFTPLADLEETDKAWTVEVELPGVKKKDVSVESHGRTIVIAGERKERERKGVIRQRNRVTGTFRYEVSLPGAFDPDGIKAALADGELTVTVPKLVEEQPHKIPIK